MPNKSFVEAIFLKENSELSNSILGPFGALREKRILRMGLDKKKIITLSQIKDTLPEFKGLIISEAKRKLLVSLFALLTNKFDGAKTVENTEAINAAIAASVEKLGEIRQSNLSESTSSGFEKKEKKTEENAEFISTFLLPTIDYTVLSKTEHAQVVQWLREGFEKLGVSGEDGKITISGFAYNNLPPCLKNQISEKNYTSLYQQLASTNIIFNYLSANQDKIQNLKEFSKECSCEIPGFINLWQLFKDIVEILLDNSEIRSSLTEDMSATLYDRYCNFSRDIFYFSCEVTDELLKKIEQSPAQSENIFKLFCEDINPSVTNSANNSSEKGRHSRHYFSLSSSDPSSTKEKKDKKPLRRTSSGLMDKPSAFFSTKGSKKTYVKILKEDPTYILAQLAINRGFASYVSHDLQAHLNKIIEKTIDSEEHDLTRSCVLIVLRLHDDESINEALVKVMGYKKDLERNLNKEFLNQLKDTDPVDRLLSTLFFVNQPNHLRYILLSLIQNQSDFKLKLIFSDLFASIKKQDEETYLAIMDEFSMASDPLTASILLTTERFEGDRKSFAIYRQLQITASSLAIDQLIKLPVPPTFSFTEAALNKLYQPLFEALKTDLSLAVRLLDIKDDNYLVRQLFQFEDTEHQIFSAMGNLISQYETLDPTQRELVDTCIEKINNVLGHKKFIARHPELREMYYRVGFSSESSQNSLSMQ